MGARTSLEAKETAARQFLDEQATAAELAERHGVRPSTVWRWARDYADAHGLARPKRQQDRLAGAVAVRDFIAGAGTPDELVERLKAHRDATKRAKASSRPRHAGDPAKPRAALPVKEHAAKRYLAGRATAQELAVEHGVTPTTVYSWVRIYRAEHGLR